MYCIVLLSVLFISISAKFDLGMGAHCDEVNERRYCSEGLVCHKCPNQNDYTCVRCKYKSKFILCKTHSGE